ncbi:MAG: heavy-metal-associated domain-containing protein [Ruminococcaceae bacterium]|nr:heavy-metal-associated domain-containing protein [Oscillospiraceae bacterium]MBQ6873074.1 cation transporter [Clostridia bacterium]
MKKVFKMEELECANCAAKMEAAISKLEGVEKVSISFMTQKMIIVADDEKLESIMDEAQKICKRFEPDCRIVR